MAEKPFRVSTSTAPGPKSAEEKAIYPKGQFGPSNPGATKMPAQAPEGTGHCHSPAIPYPKDQPLEGGKARPFKLPR